MREMFSFSLFFFIDHALSCINTIHTITFVDKTKREHDQFSGATQQFAECSLITWFISEVYTVKR